MTTPHQASRQEFHDDGSGRIAILGVFLVMAVIVAGVALNMSI